MFKENQYSKNFAGPRGDYVSPTTVGNRSLNRGQRQALLDDDLDRAILEGRN